MKPIDIKSSTYIDLGKKTTKEDPKFKVANCVRISKYKTFLRTVTFWSEEVSVISKVENTVSWTYVISDY